MKNTAFAILALMASLTACSNDNDAQIAAKHAGWTNVNVTDSSYWLDFTCGDHQKAYEIKGINPSGQESEATVCCGHSTFMKGCTIRYD